MILFDKKSVNYTTVNCRGHSDIWRPFRDTKIAPSKYSMQEQ